MLPHCLGFFNAGFALVAKCFPICDYNKKRLTLSNLITKRATQFAFGSPAFIVIICMVLHVLVYLVFCAV